MNLKLKPTVVGEMYHARLGGSGASAWLKCADWEGGGAASIYAAEGSVVHQVAAECLLHKSDACLRIGESFTSDGFTVVFTEDHARIAQTYIDYCRDMIEAYDGDLVLVESSLPIDHITGEPNAVSTIDFGIIPLPSMTEMLVVDLKTGAGVAVSADNNPQGVLYAIAMFDQYELTANIKTVRIVIVQPPLNSISEWVISVDELEVWRKKFAKAAHAAMQDEPLATPGTTQCRWCSKKATCKALASDMFSNLDALPPEALKAGEAACDELSFAMSQVEIMEGWCKAVRAETEKRLLDGRIVKGYKLVQGKRGNRAWTNAAEVEVLMKDTFRLNIPEMYDLALVSPTTAEKLKSAGVIGPRQWTKVAAYITQRDGKPSVAEESDTRPALDMSSATFTDLDKEAATT